MPWSTPYRPQYETSASYCANIPHNSYKIVDTNSGYGANILCTHGDASIHYDSAILSSDLQTTDRCYLWLCMGEEANGSGSISLLALEHWDLFFIRNALRKAPSEERLWGLDQGVPQVGKSNGTIISCLHQGRYVQEIGANCEVYVYAAQSMPEPLQRGLTVLFAGDTANAPSCAGIVRQSPCFAYAYRLVSMHNIGIGGGATRQWQRIWNKWVGVYLSSIWGTDKRRGRLDVDCPDQCSRPLERTLVMMR